MTSITPKAASSTHADGCIEIDLEKIVDYIVKEAKKDEMGEYDPEEILFIVQGEMEYADTLDGEE